MIYKPIFAKLSTWVMQEQVIHHRPTLGGRAHCFSATGAWRVRSPMGIFPGPAAALNGSDEAAAVGGESRALRDSTIVVYKGGSSCSGDGRAWINHHQRGREVVWQQQQQQLCHLIDPLPTTSSSSFHHQKGKRKKRRHSKMILPSGRAVTSEFLWPDRDAFMELLCKLNDIEGGDFEFTRLFCGRLVVQGCQALVCIDLNEEGEKTVMSERPWALTLCPGSCINFPSKKKKVNCQGKGRLQCVDISHHRRDCLSVSVCMCLRFAWFCVQISEK